MKKKMRHSLICFLPGEGEEGITRNRRCGDICDGERKKIRNKGRRRGRKGCWGASGVALYVNQKHKVLSRPGLLSQVQMVWADQRRGTGTRYPHRLLPAHRRTSFSFFKISCRAKLHTDVELPRLD